MYPSWNTHSRSIGYKETLAIVPTTSTISPSLSKSDLDNIHNKIKAMTDEHHSDMKTLNDHISTMITKLIDTSSNIDKQEE